MARGDSPKERGKNGAQKSGIGQLRELRRFVLAALTGTLVLVGFAMVPAEAASFVYVASSGRSSTERGTVSVIDAATNTVTTTVQVGAFPVGVAVYPDGTRVYVANNGDSTISVIDTATNSVTATVAIGELGVSDVAVHPDGNRLYVPVLSTRTVAVIDTATNAVVARVPVGRQPRSVAVHPAGTRVYVANVDLITPSGSISVIDTSTNTETARLPLNGLPFGLAVHPDRTRLYVATASFDTDTTSAPGTVLVIDTATNLQVARVPVGRLPEGVAVHPAGTRAYVSTVGVSGASAVSVIDTATNTETARVPVGQFPTGVAVNPDGTRVYVANLFGDTVSVIDTATNTVVATVPVGIGPRAITVIPRVAAAPSPVARARVTLNASQFQPGQTVTIGIEAENPCANPTLDLYVGALLPDGQTAVFFSDSGLLSGPLTLAAPASLPRLREASPCVVLNEPSFFRFTFPTTGVPPGTYQIFVALVRQGALQDNRIDPGDILTLDIKPLTFSPPLRAPLQFTAPATLPPATVGAPYRFVFCEPEAAMTELLCGGSPPFTPSTNPTGGEPPYHFELGTLGGFPPFGISLSLNGLLSGTPTVAGTKTFVVCAVDLLASQACQTVTLTVNPPIPAGTAEVWSGTLTGTLEPGQCPNASPGKGLYSENGTITIFVPSPGLIAFLTPGSGATGFRFTGGTFTNTETVVRQANQPCQLVGPTSTGTVSILGGSSGVVSSSRSPFGREMIINSDSILIPGKLIISGRDASVPVSSLILIPDNKTTTTVSGTWVTAGPGSASGNFARGTFLLTKQ